MNTTISTRLNFSRRPMLCLPCFPYTSVGADRMSLHSSAMTGGYLVGLLLLSMAWLFFAGGAVMNFSALRAVLRAQAGERAPSGIPFLPGVAGSVAAFFTLPAL